MLPIQPVPEPQVSSFGRLPCDFITCAIEASTNHDPDMFLFAKLVLNNLGAQPNQQSFLAEIELDVFPDTLSAA